MVASPPGADDRAGEMKPSREPTGRDLVAATVPYLLAGIVFGIILVKSEVVSWFRIQEMFRFQSFHMYGILGSAVLTAFISVHVLQHFRVRSLQGESIGVPPKQMGRGYRYWLGGGIFGIGWALTGTCPGPLFALIGAGASIFIVVAAMALTGTWTYAQVRNALPH